MQNIQIIERVSLALNGEVKSFIQVKGGVSNAEVFKAEVKGKNYLVKIISPCNTWRKKWYDFLQGVKNKNIACPFKYFEVDGGLCLISPFIDGDNLDQKLNDLSLEEVKRFAKKSAKILLSLHEREIAQEDYYERFKIKTLELIEKVIKYRLSFEGVSKCVDFLKDCLDKKEKERIVLLHKDIRAENFIVSGKDVFLIDFENGTIGGSAGDFSYLTTMEKPEYRTFCYYLIKEYLSKTKDKNFWENNLFYSTIALLEYAVWKWENKGKQVKRQAENFIYQYDNLTSNIPRWWKEIEKNNKGY